MINKSFRKILLVGIPVVVIAVTVYFYLPSFIDNWAYSLESREQIEASNGQNEVLVCTKESEENSSSCIKEEYREEIEEENGIAKLPQTEEKEILKLESVLLDVPFVCQAPNAEWDNDIFQEGCEEVSVLMAVAWARGQDLSKELAREEIIKMAEYQTKNYGEYRDTSAQDTVDRLIKGYFDYSKAEVKRGISLDDLIAELLRNKVVIVPVDGRALGNPYFTQPGPEKHMLVVIGYDAQTGQFITNEGGTRRGEKYRYNQDVLFNSIRDYTTGFHQPIEKVEKVMIVVWK